MTHLETQWGRYRSVPSCRKYFHADSTCFRPGRSGWDSILNDRHPLRTHRILAADGRARCRFLLSHHAHPMRSVGSDSSSGVGGRDSWKSGVGDRGSWMCGSRDGEDRMEVGWGREQTRGGDDA